MPFKNQQQRAACWVQYNRDLDAGKKPQWDCKKWEKESLHRCKGKTQNKKRCSRIVLGNTYCWQHE
jgi:hypothetical protein